MIILLRFREGFWHSRRMNTEEIEIANKNRLVTEIHISVRILKLGLDFIFPRISLLVFVFLAQPTKYSGWDGARGRRWKQHGALNVQTVLVHDPITNLLWFSRVMVTKPPLFANGLFGIPGAYHLTAFVAPCSTVFNGAADATLLLLEGGEKVDIDSLFARRWTFELLPNLFRIHIPVQIKLFHKTRRR